MTVQINQILEKMKQNCQILLLGKNKIIIRPNFKKIIIVHND